MPSRKIKEKGGRRSSTLLHLFLFLFHSRFFPLLSTPLNRNTDSEKPSRKGRKKKKRVIRGGGGGKRGKDRLAYLDHLLPLLFTFHFWERDGWEGKKRENHGGKEKKRRGVGGDPTQ